MAQQAYSKFGRKIANLPGLLNFEVQDPSSPTLENLNKCYSFCLSMFNHRTVVEEGHSLGELELG